MVELLIFIVIIVVFGQILLSTLFRSKSDFKAPKTKAVTAQTLKAFEAAPSLFVNDPERIFYLTLKKYLPQGYDLQTKTRLEDIIRVKASIKGKERWGHRGRIKSRHVDFLIINQQGVPIAAIELDGKSHNPKNPSAADQLKTGLFKQVQIPLWRVRVGESFEQNAATICAQLSLH